MPWRATTSTPALGKGTSCGQQESVGFGLGCQSPALSLLRPPSPTSAMNLGMRVLVTSSCPAPAPTQSDVGFWIALVTQDLTSSPHTAVLLSSRGQNCPQVEPSSFLAEEEPIPRAHPTGVPSAVVAALGAG